uniref:Uncharacterized protein n=1 Tax=Panagrolaimus superbus TaxID=310955 RepID=A0A914YCM8_9BILA
MVNTVVESWNFLMGGNLFNFIPLNQRPKHEDFDPFINTSSSITPDITTIPSVKATTNIDKSVTDSGAEITSTIVVEKTSESNGAASKNTEFKMFSMVLTGIFINYYYY